MWLLPISILIVTTLLAIPLSKYLTWITDGKYRPWGPFRWIEDKLNNGPQNWKQYTGALLLFNTVLFVFGFIVLSLQPILPLNDLGRGMLAPSTIFHGVVSFMTNTDLQHYSGDQHFLPEFHRRNY
jgi:potassium-transporting ATPase potassium-binding subunit